MFLKEKQVYFYKELLKCRLNKNLDEKFKGIKFSFVRVLDLLYKVKDTNYM